MLLGDGGSHAGGVVETLLKENANAVRLMVRAGNASAGRDAGANAAQKGAPAPAE